MNRIVTAGDQALAGLAAISERVTRRDEREWIAIIADLVETITVKELEIEALRLHIDDLQQRACLLEFPSELLRRPGAKEH